MPKRNTTNMQVFVKAFDQAFPDTFHVILLDNSAVHTTKRLRLHANVALVFLPAYSPELNPSERLWQDLWSRTAWRTFADRDALEAERCTQRAHDTPCVVQSLTSYPYLERAIADVSPWPHDGKFDGSSS